VLRETTSRGLCGLVCPSRTVCVYYCVPNRRCVCLLLQDLVQSCVRIYVCVYCLAQAQPPNFFFGRLLVVLFTDPNPEFRDYFTVCLVRITCATENVSGTKHTVISEFGIRFPKLVSRLFHKFHSRTNLTLNACSANAGNDQRASICLRRGLEGRSTGTSRRPRPAPPWTPYPVSKCSSVRPGGVACGV
jgi:hypothetical protein